MIQYIACDIKDKIMASGFVTEHYEFGTIIRRDDKTFPAMYIGGGNYETLSDKDINGHSYLRTTGKVTYSNPLVTDNVKTSSCGGDDFVQVNIPLRIVLTVPKSKLGDNAFSEQRLADEVLVILSDDITITEIVTRSINYNVTDIDTDPLSVWRGEVSGVDYQMNFRYAYIAVNFTAQVIINPSCLLDACQY